ncbi:MAG: VOC family protein [Rhodobacteraceae bacterium]|nr:VOC family protein [Paracoccaceae bacterium]
MSDQAKIFALDHLVLTVADIAATVRFYCSVLGLSEEVFHPCDGSGRHALKFGSQKINLHPAAAPFAPHASHPATGSADLCFLSDWSLEAWQAHLENHNVVIEQGPIERTGATGPIVSLYIRDPDGNLIEIANRA